MALFWRLFSVFTVAVFALINSFVSAQSDFFKTCKPEAAIVVKRHQMGGDLVDITVSSKTLSEAALVDKVLSLDKIINGNARGISAQRVNENFVKASFAINGLINDTDPKLNLEALAQAFGTGKDKIQRFSVFFENVVPDRSIPARWFPEDKSWRLEGVATRTPAGIDYRLEVSTSDPAKIELPGPKPIAKPETKNDHSEKPDIVLIGAILVGALAVGLLVYSALTRPQRR